jgi:hypothetical protein
VLVEKQYGYAIDILCEDKGREYTGKEWDAFMGEHSIRRENTVRATPQQNGVAERKNWILAELITAVLNESKLPKSFWGEALSYVNKVLNMVPSDALAVNTTPFGIMEKRKPDYSRLCVFGCHAFAHVGKDKHKSLNSHTVPCIFLSLPMITRVGGFGILARRPLLSPEMLSGTSMKCLAPPLSMYHFCLSPQCL